MGAKCQHRAWDVSSQIKVIWKAKAGVGVPIVHARCLSPVRTHLYPTIYYWFTILAKCTPTHRQGRQTVIISKQAKQAVRRFMMHRFGKHY